MTKLTANCLGILLLANVVSAQESREKVHVDDVERTYVVRLPKGYNSRQRYEA
jgi:hypothetical protein